VAGGPAGEHPQQRAKMKEKILLIGGGGHCRSCIDVIERENRFEVAGIVDEPEKKNQVVLGYSVIGSDADLPSLIKLFPHVLITLGHIRSPRRRIELFDELERMGANFPTIKSPLAYVSPHARIAGGSIIMHYALVNAGARVGKNCIVNSRALVEHDAVIDDHCHVATGAVVNGGVNMGRGTFYGSCAVSEEYTAIPPGSFIKAGSVFSKKR